MKKLPYFPLRVSCLLAIGFAALISGCSKDAVPVESAKARETLVTALDQWKAGSSVEALQKASPPIFVNDTDWSSGSVLKEYRLMDDGKEMDIYFSCLVELKLVLRDKSQVVRTVTYMVRTSPELTIKRKMF
jgi:hypothetical protein